MNPFLKQVADYLYTNHRAELSDFTLVFPGRRAGVFFTAYLNEMVQESMLSPEIITINELISSLTGLQQADQVALVLKLQEVYSKVTGHQEPLDEFFFWGEILLSDFDDIDKYLLDADDLFRNIADLKDLDNQFEYLTPEQKRAIEEFWGHLEKAPNSINKEKFIAIWIQLASIYHQLKEVLRNEQLAYSGMIYREVADQFDELIPLLKAKKYVFVGFNALNECEKIIFKNLDNLNRALFFWDFDEFYLNDPENEAGRFLHTNRSIFPAPRNFTLAKTIPPKNRKITMVSVPGNTTQAQAVNLPQVLKSFQIDAHFDNTAFVLADENLLIPVISAVGNSFSDINITMGYPFVNTPVYGFISQLISLQRQVRKTEQIQTFYHKQVLAVLNHQFMADSGIKSFVADIHQKNKFYIESSELQFNPFLTKVFTSPDGWTNMLDYFLEILTELSLKFNSLENEQVKLESEYLYQAFLVLQRLKDSLTSLNITDFPVKILFRLIDQSLRRISIPFEGEPLTGLQIMGLLETRCLDFENLVIFSANEGFLPRISASHSFVPYHLRKGFGMPTTENRDAMYAYYFYRLIQRSENTVCVYNSITEGIASAEKSRFLYQLLYDSEFEIEEINLCFNFKGTTNEPIRIQATPSHINHLISTYSERRLSPSAINTYLECKLKFYLRYIAGIKESEELKEEIDSALFGNIFHYAIELLYRPFENKTVEAEHLRQLKNNLPRIEAVVSQAIAVKHYKMKPEEFSRVRLRGQSILIASHVRDYIIQMLENDIKIAPFKIIGLEKDYLADYEVISDEQTFRIKIGGIVDRLDQSAEGLKIIDYKTGKNLKIEFTEWSQLFDRNYSDRRKEILQTLIYADIASRTANYPAIWPVIYRLDSFFSEEFAPNILFLKEKMNYADFVAEFGAIFSELLSEIFSINNTYDQTNDSEKCSYCPYNKICRR